MRRKALIIMAYSTPDRALAPVEKCHNKDVAAGKSKTFIRSTESLDFLIAREKQNKRLGFIEIELRPNESVQDALRRHLPWSVVALKRPWQLIETFRHRDWEVSVGWVEVGPDQRSADLYEQSDSLPYTVEWQTPHWFSRQVVDGQLNEVTERALDQLLVAKFLQESQHRKAAA